MTEINNVSAFAASGNSKIDKNSVDNSFRKEIQKKNLEFKQDKQLNETEMKLLKKEFGMNEAQVKEWAAMENGVEFLEAMLHAKGDSKKDIKAAREQIAKEFLLQNRTISLGSSDAKLSAQLKEFGVDIDEQHEHVQNNWLNSEYKLGTITPDPSSGNTNVENIRINIPEDINGEKTLKRLDLFDASLEYDSDMNAVDSNPLYKGSLLLDEETGVYVKYNREEGQENEYFKLNGDQGLVRVSKDSYDEAKASFKAAKEAEFTEAKKLDDAKKAEEAKLAAEAAKAEAEAAAQAAAKAKADSTKAAFQGAKSVTVDSTGSKQKLWADNVKETGVKVPKRATYDENGLPSVVAIELPGDYGSVGPDGIKQKRYQEWKLIDAEQQIYADKAGIRNFRAEIDSDGNITFKQVNIDDVKTKKFLDDNAKVVAETAKQTGLNAEQTKMEIPDKPASEELMSKLSDRNSSWETYLQVGSDNGYITGSQGLLEKLLDEGGTTELKSYNDLKPAIDGLMARVPESAQNSPEYKAVQAIIDELKKNPDADLKNNWASQMFRFGDTPIRALDKALMDLGQTHIAGKVQGANHANNSFLVGGRGAVTIQPDNKASGFMSDAKFTIGGQDYYMYEPNEALWIDRTVDFQDLVTHSGKGDRALITNDVTGNNRYGEIKFNAAKLKDMDEDLYLEGGNPKAKYNIKADGDVAYIYSPNGKNRVPIEDVLNGKVGLPKDS